MLRSAMWITRQNSLLAVYCLLFSRNFTLGFSYQYFVGLPGSLLSLNLSPPGSVLVEIYLAVLVMSLPSV